MSQITELIVDAFGCRADLSDLARLEAAAVTAVKSVGATIATSTSHRFQPHGLTLCLILMESHFVVSTWPEHRIAVVNIFLSNDSMNARRVWEIFSETLQPTEVELHDVVHRIPQMKTLLT